MRDSQVLALETLNIYYLILEGRSMIHAAMTCAGTTMIFVFCLIQMWQNGIKQKTTQQVNFPGPQKRNFQPNIKKSRGQLHA